MKSVRPAPCLHSARRLHSVPLLRSAFQVHRAQTAAVDWGRAVLAFSLHRLQQYFDREFALLESLLLRTYYGREFNCLLLRHNDFALGVIEFAVQSLLLCCRELNLLMQRQHQITLYLQGLKE